MSEVLFTETYKQYAGRSIIVDTNQLLILLIGNYDQKNNKNYLQILGHSNDEFERLKDFLQKLGIKIVITPEILAEISDMINIRLPKDKFGEIIESISEILRNVQEMYIEKDTILDENICKKLGFPDTSIIILSKNEDYPILTGETPLIRECRSKKLEVITSHELISV